MSNRIDGGFGAVLTTPLPALMRLLGAA
jgi:hypothetical protein